jgi:uncharacterized protein with FMN-binding domain
VSAARFQDQAKEIWMRLAPFVAGAALAAALPLTAVPLVRIAGMTAGQDPRVTAPAAPAADTSAPRLVNVSLSDGTFTGPAVDAYWGNLQVQVVVQNGRITSLSVPKYPSDRRESQRINQQALPLLRNEVVAAQTASVNIVSGATLTSEAFMTSLQSALSQAGGAPAPSVRSAPSPGRNGGFSIGI